MDQKVLQTLGILTDFFLQQNITYHLTGGLAGNIYGSKWPLSDVDVEVHFEDLNLIENFFSTFVTRRSARFVDSEFDIWLLQLNIYGVPVDVNAVEDFYIFRGSERIKIHTSLQNSKFVKYHGIELRVQNLVEIIAYKRLLGRAADIEDLLGLAE